MPVSKEEFKVLEALIEGAQSKEGREILDRLKQELLSLEIKAGICTSSPPVSSSSPGLTGAKTILTN